MLLLSILILAVQEEIVLPFVGPSKTLPASPEHCAKKETFSLHVQLPKRAPLDMQGPPPYLSVQPALAAAAERSWDTGPAEVSLTL